MKRFIALIIALVMACPLAFASVPVAEKAANTATYQIPEEEVEKSIQAQVDAYIDSLDKEINSLRSDRDYTYYTQKIDTKYVTRSGYAGNQPTNGVRFTTGGSFFWEETGGPTIGGSVTFSDPFHMVSVTIDLGIKSDQSTGYIVNVPTTDAYYKLYVSKTMRVDQYNTYQTNLITGETRLYWTTYPKTIDSYALSAIRVG